MPENEEIVTVPVPARLLPVVYRALSEAMRDENTRATQNGQALPAVQRNGALDFTDVSNCRRLRAGLTSPGLVNKVVQMLDHLASRADQWESFADIAHAVGRTRDQLQGDSRSLTRVIKRVFDNDRCNGNDPFSGHDASDWPIKLDWAREGDSQRYYMMPLDVARAWLASA
jgi:hypothetical protein